MQQVSSEYKKSMKSPFRNRGYIRVRIGIINREAQRMAGINDSKTELTWFSTPHKAFDGYTVDKLYGTSENDFTKVDGSMYFLPEQNSEMEIYNNGIITEELLGKVYIDFAGITGLDIKGLTIDFGDCYPTLFTIESDSGIKSYMNDKPLFLTEDVFNGTSFFVITPLAMLNEYGRLRIHQFNCGIFNTFTNKEVLKYTYKEYISSITETLPSQDMSIEVDNQNLYYSPDNPDSALAFMEQGQEIEVSFGYDLTQKGDIEWVEPNATYLKSWSANDVTAKFTAVDIFEYELNETYLNGIYRESGISLYDLALDVLWDAGITNERDYFVDPYLKKILAYNPMPIVKHSEALQIIANAGRCTLFIDRKKRIHIQSSFIPDCEASANNMTDYSHIDKLLKDTEKKSYAICSRDFSAVDGSMYFFPEDPSEYFEDTGYVSESIYHESPPGTIVNRLPFRLGNTNAIDKVEREYFFWDGEAPKIIIAAEASFVSYGLIIKFRGNAPKEFVIETYNEDIPVQRFVIKNPEIEYISYEQFDLFDRMEITFTKGYPDSRIAVDKILIGDIAEYTISRTYDVYNTPTAIRQNKVKTISVNRTLYKETEEISDLSSDEITLSEQNTEIEIRFSKPAYDLSVEIEDNESVTPEIIESSSYYAKIRFSRNSEEKTAIRYVLKGKEYIKEEKIYQVEHNEKGEEISWDNPLISTEEQARDIEEWLASYYLGDVDYQISWRGDPRVDANDLLYLELRDRPNTLIRAYENEIKFNGAWSATMKARKAAIKWQ